MSLRPCSSRRSKLKHKYLLGMLSALALGATGTSAQAQVSGFVMRQNAQLLVNGQFFRFSGSNAEWMGAPGNTTAFQVRDTLFEMREMGQTVLRSLWLTSVGPGDALQTSLGQYNDDAFRRADYVIWQAGLYGIRVIIPLCDQDANGDGAYTFYTNAQNRNLSASDFYTDRAVIDSFKAFISVYLNHVNVFTGVANRDNPTILGWETGNELQDAPPGWTTEIADYIKSIDGNHLVIDGACQFNGFDPGCSYPAGHLTIANVDMYTDHFYPMRSDRLNAAANAAADAGKAYFPGEYDWAGFNQGGSSLGDFVGAVEGNFNVAGDMLWQIFGHRDLGGYQQYRYGGALGLAVGLHYPGDDQGMRDAVQTLRNHAYALRGSSPPAYLPTDAPQALAVSGQLVTWRGSPGGDTYTIRRSTSGPDGPFDTICDRCVTDRTGFYIDANQPAGPVWYQLQAFNLGGEASGFSNTVAGLGSPIGDAGFEAGSNTNWTLGNGAQFALNNSGYTSGNPNAPEANYVAVLQNNGFVQQSVSLPTNNNACIAFTAAQRGNYNSGGQDIDVVIDNTTIGTIRPNEADYLLYTTPVFNVATPNHTLTLRGRNSTGGDNTALIDTVGIIPNCTPIAVDRGF